MGQAFLPNLSASGIPTMCLREALQDRMAMEMNDPVPFHFIDFNPYDMQIRFGRWPTRDKLFGGAGFADAMFGNPWLDIVPVEVTGTAKFIYRIIGTVVNNIGTPVAGITCTLYKTTDKSVQGVTTTNADGQYGFGVPDNSTLYYIIASQESPAIFAGSVNTLVGSL
jgi:hypothetical protein